MVVLAQTDTTVGFLSQDSLQLQKLKSRLPTKPFIIVYKNFDALNLRIPKQKRALLRRSKKTSFIVKDTAFRVAQPTLNSQILRNNAWNYSTSANESQKSYEREFCESKADIIIEDKNLLFEGQASTLLKITNKKIRRLR